MGSPGTRSPLRGMERPLPGGEHLAHLWRGTRGGLRSLREDCHLLSAGDTVLPQGLWAQGERLRGEQGSACRSPVAQGMLWAPVTPATQQGPARITKPARNPCLPVRNTTHSPLSLDAACIFFLTKVFLKNHKEPRVLSGQVDKASQSLHVGSRTRCPGSSAVSSVTGPPPRVTGVLTPVIPPQVSPACAGPCVVSRARGNAPRPGVTRVTHPPLC